MTPGALQKRWNKVRNAARFSRKSFFNGRIPTITGRTGLVQWYLLENHARRRLRCCHARSASQWVSRIATSKFRYGIERSTVSALRGHDSEGSLAVEFGIIVRKVLLEELE